MSPANLEKLLWDHSYTQNMFFSNINNIHYNHVEAFTDGPTTVGESTVAFYMENLLLHMNLSCHTAHHQHQQT